MEKRVKNKIGDTLVEVMIAVGVFSLIAVAVVAVVTRGSSDIQTALETTIVRNEIDAQAEALRFIQAAYASELKDKKTNNYTKLWNDIIALANESNESITKFNITNNIGAQSCNMIYDGGGSSMIVSQNAFIINTRRLAEPEKVLIKARGSDSFSNPQLNAHFVEAPVYPRLSFREEDDKDLLSDDREHKDLKDVEGIYIVAVKGDDAETYYDFYIRTCWYGAGADVPSTISTLVRLYNPNI